MLPLRTQTNNEPGSSTGKARKKRKKSNWLEWKLTSCLLDWRKTPSYSSSSFLNETIHNKRNYCFVQSKWVRLRFHLHTPFVLRNCMHVYCFKLRYMVFPHRMTFHLQNAHRKSNNNNKFLKKSCKSQQHGSYHFLPISIGRRLSSRDKRKFHCLNVSLVLRLFSFVPLLVSNILYSKSTYLTSFVRSHRHIQLNIIKFNELFETKRN